MGIEKITIIGAGGIGSHLAKQLVHKVTKNQFNSLKKIDIWDPDKIELKNKNYTIYDCDNSQIGNYKVSVLKEELDFMLTMADKHLDITVYKEKHQGFSSLELHSERNSYFISAVDGSSFREDLFNAGTSTKALQRFKNYNCGWIDARSKGARFIVIRNPQTLDGISAIEPYYAKSDIEGDSCQLAADLAKNQIQVGNELAALYVVKFLLNIDRGEPNELTVDYPAIANTEY